eukprot:2417054-Amphidinium_carterae.2
MLGGKGDEFRRAVQRLRQKFQWGKWTDASQPRDFNGRTIQQLSEHKVTVSMIQPVRKLVPLQIPSPRERHATSAATEREITAYRGLLGKIMWAAVGNTVRSAAGFSSSEHIGISCPDIESPGHERLESSIAAFAGYGV